MTTRLFCLTFVFLVTSVGCTSSRKADDPANSLGSVIYLSDGEPAAALATGPFVLTDVMIDGHAWEVFTSTDAACKARDGGSLFDLVEPADKPTTAQNHHGMNLMVTAGKTLCFHSSIGQTKLVWAGIRAGR